MKLILLHKSDCIQIVSNLNISMLLSNRKIKLCYNLIIINLDSCLAEYIMLSVCDLDSNEETLTEISSISPYSSTHLKNLPPKNWTPIIEKISQNTRQTRSTLNILGIAYINAFTTICEPGRKISDTQQPRLRCIILFVFQRDFHKSFHRVFCLLRDIYPHALPSRDRP